jgi:hypothetical protein
LTKTIKKKWSAAKNVINEGRSIVSAGRKEVRNNGYKGLVNSAKPFLKGAGEGIKEAEHKNILKQAGKAGLKGAAKGAVKGAIVGSVLGPKGAVINGARTGLKSGAKKAGLSLLLSYGKEAYNGGKDAYREHRSANQGYEMDTFMDMSEDNLEYVGSRVPTKVVWKDGRFQRVNDWGNAKKPIWISPSQNPYAKESYSTGYPSWHTDEDGQYDEDEDYHFDEEDLSESDLEYVGSRVPTKVVWKDGRFQRVNYWGNAKKPIWVSQRKMVY